MTFADKAYQGARGGIRTPFKRHRYRPKLSRWQKKVDSAHARIRAIGERANATLKTSKILAKLALLPTPRHRDRDHRPTPRREPDLPRMKKAHCVSATPILIKPSYAQMSSNLVSNSGLSVPRS
jgi:hypothetical protein